MKKRNNQKGFTIIELVVVILLLGILTATALPRFMDVTDDAHAAVVSAVVGGLGTGTALYKAQWYANNQPTTVTEFNGITAHPVSGYPVGTKTGGLSTLRSVGTTAHCVEIFQNVLQSGGQPTISGAKTASATTIGAGAGTFTVTGTNDFVAYLATGSSLLLNTCNYIYTGQYTNNTLYNLPVIQYNARTGAVTTRSI